MYILIALPLLILLAVISLLLLYFKRYKGVLMALTVLILLNWWTECIPMNPSSLSQGIDEFSVECFNIHSGGEKFDERSITIADQILHDKPKFVYLTEYVGISSPMLDSLLKEHYKYAASSYKYYLETERFYSKWQIDSVFNLEIDTMDTKVMQRCAERPEIRSHLKRIWVYRIQIHEAKDTVAIYCCHLDTNNFGAVMDSIPDRGISLLKHWKRFIKATEIGYAVRELETDAIIKSLRSEKYPYIVMGDMNDISGSYTIRSLQRTGMKDAWWEKGCGYGCTFHDYGMRLRLDHILYDYKRLNLNRVEVLDSNLSDHNAIIASFNFK